jgi:hypothetical protein
MKNLITNEVYETSMTLGDKDKRDFSSGFKNVNNFSMTFQLVFSEMN